MNWIVSWRAFKRTRKCFVIQCLSLCALWRAFVFYFKDIIFLIISLSLSFYLFFVCLFDYTAMTRTAIQPFGNNCFTELKCEKNCNKQSRTEGESLKFGAAVEQKPVKLVTSKRKKTHFVCTVLSKFWERMKGSRVFPEPEVLLNFFSYSHLMFWFWFLWI